MTGTASIVAVYFLVLLLLFAVTYLSGLFIFVNVFKKSPGKLFSSLFICCLVGAVLLTSAGAILFTGGKTIAAAYLLVAAFILTEKRLGGRVEGPLHKFRFEGAAIAKIILVMVFAYNASIVLKWNGVPVDQIEKDTFYYAEMSKALVETGQENTFVTANLVSEAYRFPTPYHYFDLWLNGTVAKIFHLNYSLSLILVIYSFFITVFAFGILACFEHYGEVSARILPLSFLLVFVSGLYITERVLHNTRYIAQMEGIAERYGGKLAPVYCFSLLFFYLFVLKKNRAAILLLLFLPLISISLAPAVLGGLLCFILIKISCDKGERIFYLRVFFYTLILMTFIGAFYFFLKKNDLNYRFDRSLSDYTDLTEFSLFRIKYFLVELWLKIWAHPFLFALNYLPFLSAPLLLFLRRNAGAEMRNTGMILVLIFISGLLASNSLYLMDDSHQLYINSLVILHAFFAFCFVQVFYSGLKFRLPVMGFFVAALICSVFQNYASYKRIDNFGFTLGEKYLAAVNELAGESAKKLKGGIFYDKNVYRNVLITYPLEYYACPVIVNANLYTPFNLTGPNIDEKWNVNQYQKEILRNPFTRYLAQKKKENPSISDTDARIAFIREFDLDYLLIPESDTTGMEGLVFSKMLRDEVSGQRFVLLKK